MHQLESKTATQEHFSKHPDELREKKKSMSSISSEPETDEEEEELSGFAELVKALTLGSDGNEAEALRETFKILDCDEDGYITLSDLREAMSNFDEDQEVDDEELVEMIAAADDKGNGKISFDSFIRILEPKSPKSPK